MRGNAFAPWWERRLTHHCHVYMTSLGGQITAFGISPTPTSILLRWLGDRPLYSFPFSFSLFHSPKHSIIVPNPSTAYVDETVDHSSRRIILRIRYVAKHNRDKGRTSYSAFLQPSNTKCYNSYYCWVLLGWSAPSLQPIVEDIMVSSSLSSSTFSSSAITTDLLVPSPLPILSVRSIDPPPLALH